MTEPDAHTLGLLEAPKLRIHSPNANGHTIAHLPMFFRANLRPRRLPKANIPRVFAASLAVVILHNAGYWSGNSAPAFSPRFGTAAAGETLPSGEVVGPRAGPALVLSFILLWVVSCWGRGALLCRAAPQ